MAFFPEVRDDGLMARPGYQFPKYIRVTDLTRLLAELRPDDGIHPNRVSNLSVIRDGESIGYIDLAGEEGEEGEETVILHAEDYGRGGA